MILIRTDMLATCRIPCPLGTASEYFMYTYLNYLNFLYKNCDTFIRTDMLATCRIPCPLRSASVNLILIDSFTYIRMDMLATCRIPCRVSTTREYFIYTYLNYFNLYIQIVNLWRHGLLFVISAEAFVSERWISCKLYCVIELFAW